MRRCGVHCARALVGGDVGREHAQNLSLKKWMGERGVLHHASRKTHLAGAKEAAPARCVFSIVCWASASATMYTSPPCSSATYSNSGWNATAMEAGSVQGVVVQIIVLTFLPANAGSIFPGSLVRRYFTQTLGLVCMEYSISASASAVLSKMHQ